VKKSIRLDIRTSLISQILAKFESTVKCAKPKERNNGTKAAIVEEAPQHSVSSQAPQQLPYRIEYTSNISDHDPEKEQKASNSHGRGPGRTNSS
jgi:hypothetical protein